MVFIEEGTYISTPMMTKFYSKQTKYVDIVQNSVIFLLPKKGPQASRLDIIH